MTRRTEQTQNQIRLLEPSVTPDQVRLLRHNLRDPRYMNEAIQRLAQELSIELMETTYGIPFR